MNTKEKIRELEKKKIHEPKKKIKKRADNSDEIVVRSSLPFYFYMNNIVKPYAR